MTHSPRRSRRLFLSAAAISIAPALVLLPGQRNVCAAEAAGEVLVVVNGEPLTSSVLESYRRDLHSASDDASSSSRLVEDIDRVLVIQDGRAHGYTLDDAQFSSVVDKIKKDNRVSDDAHFAEALEVAQLTITTLRQRLERQMIMSRMHGLHGASATDQTDASVQRYYLSHATSSRLSRSRKPATSLSNV